MKFIIVTAVLFIGFTWAQDQCGDHSVFEECGPSCVPTCSNPDMEGEVCPDICVEGCFCIEGFIYDDFTKTCVEQENCSGGLPGNCTEHSTWEECGPYCIATCQNPEGDQGECPEICVQGCFCNEGYILDEDTHKCVEQDQCSGEEPGECTDHSTWEECGPYCIATCQNPEGDQGECPEVCVMGCFCDEGYILDEDLQQCVKPNDCPGVNPGHCGEHSTWNDCGSLCIATCNNPDGDQGGCPDVCVAGCFCNEGYILDEATHRCVKPDKCFDSTTCVDHSTWEDCGSPCVKTCQNPNGDEGECADVCAAGCFCNEGYILDEFLHRCVKPENCLIRADNCHAHAVWNDCGPSCIATCQDPKGNETACTDNCVQGCFCEKEYLFDEITGKCVLPEKCPSSKDCNGDENAFMEDCGSNCIKTCQNQNGDQQICPAVCRKGCTCKTGYILDELSKKCVEPKNCPL